MIYVVATIELADGMREAFLAEQRILLPLVRAEQDCIEYAPTVDQPLSDLPKTPPRADTIIMHEKWRTLANLQAHAVAPHMKAYAGKVKDFTVNRAIHVLEPA